MMLTRNSQAPAFGRPVQCDVVRCLAIPIKNNAEDRGRKPVGESVPAEGWIVLSIKYYDMLPLWKYD